MNLSPVLLAKVKDTVERAAWTFSEAFVAAFVIPPAAQMGSLATWKIVVLSAAAAGLAAVKTMLKNSKPTPAVAAAEAAA